MIDQGLPEEWPDAVGTACTRFKQGHVLPRPPFFYAATSAYGVWDLTRDGGNPELDEEILQLDEEIAAPFGMITTQTCDIYEEGKRRKPWIQVAPVYDASSVIGEDSLGNLAKGAIRHLMQLDGDAFSDGTCVVDLRVEFPIEKSWLVSKEPLEAFQGEAGYLRLAEALAGRVGRPALNTALVKVLNAVENWWEKDAVEDAKNDVVDLRMFIIGGTRLEPTAVRLLIVTDTQVMNDQGKSSWDACWRTASDVGAQHGITVAANQHESLDSLTARQVRDSAPLWPL